MVEVYTGEMENAGTEANVYLMLVGRRGDTGHRKLLKSLGFTEKKFQPRQVCSRSVHITTWPICCISCASESCALRGQFFLFHFFVDVEKIH